MKKVYFISGLGADRRAYSFLDLSFCDPVFVDWIAPEKKESLKSYALRLRKTIPDEHPIIVGVSFGGMLAVEMAKTDASIHAIILASNRSSAEFPWFLRGAKYFPFYRWLPDTVLRKSAYKIKDILGRNEKEQKQVMLDIIRETDMGFVKWALDAIFYWDNKEEPSNVIHIHGTADRLLPYKLVKADYTVDGGSHVLPMDNPREISALLKKLV